jgi:hypothetical protein
MTQNLFFDLDGQTIIRFAIFTMLCGFHISKRISWFILQNWLSQKLGLLTWPLTNSLSEYPYCDAQWEILHSHTLKHKYFMIRQAMIALFLSFFLEIGTINHKIPYIYELIISGFLRNWHN